MEVTTGTLPVMWQQTVVDGDAYKKRSQTPPTCIAFQIKEAKFSEVFSDILT